MMNLCSENRPDMSNSHLSLPIYSNNPAESSKKGSLICDLLNSHATRTPSCFIVLAVTLGVAFIEMRTATSEEIVVQGIVVDERGNPVPGASVDDFWSANGPRKNPDGSPIVPEDTMDISHFWGLAGQMEPVDGAVAGKDGKWTLSMPSSRYHLMAMDKSRQRGAVLGFAKEAKYEEVRITLSPLTHVRGTIHGPPDLPAPYWTHAYILAPEKEERPLDSCRLAGCGSLGGEFAVSLPAGRYSLDAYGQSTIESDLDLTLPGSYSFCVPEGVEKLDLGSIQLTKAHETLTSRIAKAKAKGAWGDFREHYGEKAPEWHVTGSIGLSDEVALEDLRGKWVLIVFWGFDCSPCLSRTLPRLAEFHACHAADSDKFEIISFCIDDDALASAEDVGNRLKPIVKHVWGGRPLPFPVLIDSTFATRERFGIVSMGTVVLIDPDGNLVEGDETTLAKMLRR